MSKALFETNNFDDFVGKVGEQNVYLAEMLYETSKNRMLTEAVLSPLEQEIAASFRRNGKVFGRKFYDFSTNTTASCEALGAAVGLNWAPSTDSVEGADDFITASPIFTWMHCNYTRDEDETARVTALEGRPNYKTTGAVDVGTIAPTFWWKIEKHQGYKILWMSDSPNAALGLIPWIGACKADGTVLPYYILSSYASVTASDGNLRSQPGMAPAYNQSYQNMITNYAKKGAGYKGAGVNRNLHGLLFTMMKAGTRNVQSKMYGCASFHIQTPCAVAETGVKRVLTTNTGFYAGCCVSVGSGSSSPDRGAANCNDIANRVKVESIETVSVDGTNYTALNLALDAPIDTQTTYTITSMPCLTGETDAVIGRLDGSYLSNTDGKHTIRVHGVEYLCGQYMIAADSILKKNGNFWEMYAAPKGMAHNPSKPDGYTLAGKLPYNNGSDYNNADLSIDETCGSYAPTAIGNGSTQGNGDRTYVGGAGVADGQLREVPMLGALGNGSGAGFAFVVCGYVLSWAVWYCASCD